MLVNSSNTEDRVSQGCVMPAWLFSKFLNKCIRNACGDIRCESVRNGNMLVLWYAEGAMLLAGNQNDWQ